MLHTPNEKTARLLKLADAIENSPDFNMGSWSCCIHGHICRMAGIPFIRVSEDGNNGVTAYESLDWIGVDHSLFAGLYSNRCQTKEQAARMLRHLAVTGEIEASWSHGELCGVTLVEHRG